MKLLLIFTALINMISLTARAGECPAIVGAYKCDAEDYPEEWSFESYINEGVEVFDDGTETYLLDNQSHKVDWGFFAGNYVGHCQDGKMHIVLDGFVDDDVEPIHIINNSTYTLKENGQLLWHEDYKYLGSDGEWRESQQEITCKPAPK